MPGQWTRIRARQTRGHQVASGQGGDPRFPGGTIRMQTPYFRQLGLDLGVYHPGTVNVSIAPARYRVGRPKVTFEKVKWHPTAPAEDFSFFDVTLILPDRPAVAGLIYYPHPETKPEHFQRADVLELLLPLIPQLPGELTLAIPNDQIHIDTG